MWNLIRWVTPRTIKETFVPPRDYRYPYLSVAGAWDGKTALELPFKRARLQGLPTAAREPL